MQNPFGKTGIERGKIYRPVIAGQKSLERSQFIRFEKRGKPLALWPIKENVLSSHQNIRMAVQAALNPGGSRFRRPSDKDHAFHDRTGGGRRDLKPLRYRDSAPNLAFSLD